VTPPKRGGVSQASMIVGGVIAAAVIGGVAWYGSEAGWFSS
jgi:hypothetical protein